MASLGPIALVTGASRGIGRAIAEELSTDHRVLATYVRDLASAESLEATTGASVVQADIGSPADRERLVATCLDRFGRIDLLVNNAGVAPRERLDLLEATEESFDSLISTNLKGPYFLTQLVARQMVKQGSGRIAFITSVSAYTSSTNRGEYCVSKAGLSMTVKLYADRLAADGIGVFEIRPGVIETDMIAKVRDKYVELAQGGLLPQGRLGQPQDVARAVRAIADGLLDYSTGQVLDVDGGFHLRRL
jgi:NAD(P)-dependent dehydrogenase (short-subunit alcohol dehydrogenase family)